MSKVDKKNIGEILRDRSTTSVTWKIPAFFSLTQNVDYCIESPSFKFLDADFCLRLYPKGRSLYDCQDFVGLYLVKKHSSTHIHTIEYTIGIRKTNGTAHTFFVVHKFQGNEDYWGRPFMRREEILSNKKLIAPDDTLTVFCNFQAKKMDDREASTQTTPCEGQDECIQEATGSSEEIAEKLDDKKLVSPNLAGGDSFSESMKNLLQAKFLCDITIKLKDDELRAHKIILAAHSSVFSAMFAHEMSEKNTGIIEIFDFESNVFKEFLQYLYTGSREALSPKHICEVYGLAHKYDVKHLQEECVSIMIDALTADTFCDVISLAVKYGESELTKEATNFFLENTESVLILTKWQLFMQENTTVANELFLKRIREINPK